MERYAIFTKRTRIGGKHNNKRKLKFEEGELTTSLPSSGYWLTFAWGFYVTCEPNIIIYYAKVFNDDIFLYSNITIISIFPNMLIFYECQHIKFNIYYILMQK
jgi:hypothetical protein